MCVCLCLCVSHVAPANEVFSRGGVCQSGEGGPAVLPCYSHIKSILSQWEWESKKAKAGEREGQMVDVRKKRKGGMNMLRGEGNAETCCGSIKRSNDRSKARTFDIF